MIIHTATRAAKGTSMWNGCPQSRVTVQDDGVQELGHNGNRYALPHEAFALRFVDVVEVSAERPAEDTRSVLATL